MQSSSRVDDNNLVAVSNSAFNGLKCDGGRVLSIVLRFNDVDTGALGPGGQLIDGGGAKGVRRTDKNALSARGDELGEFANRRG